MANNISSNEQSYRELIRTIKTLIASGISVQDKEVLRDLLKVLTYMCEFKVMRSCYDKDDALKEKISLLDEKIRELESQMLPLQSKLANQMPLSDFESIKLSALTISYNRYKEIKNAIETRNFDHYVAFMNDNLTNARQVISVCADVLSNANIDHAKTYVINGNDMSVLDVIYSLKKQPLLVEELETYFKRKKSYTIDNEEEVREDEKFLNYLNLIKENESMFRNFMESVSVAGKTSEDKEVAIQELLSRKKLELANLNKSIFSSLKKTREISALENEIEKYTDQLDRTKKHKERLELLFPQMEQAGLLPIANQFVSTTANLDDSVEQKVVTYVRSSMRKGSFDIQDVKTRIEDAVRTLNSQIMRKEQLLDGCLNSLSPLGKELVTKYEDDVENILDVVNERSVGEITPLFAAYALKAIMDSKSIKAKTLIEITHPSNSNNQNSLEALVRSFQTMAANTARNIGQEMQGVENRPFLDTNAFSTGVHLK